MSDNSQIFVALDCPADEAQTRGRAAIDWLVARDIVDRRAGSGDVEGHAPGPAFETAVVAPLPMEDRSHVDRVEVVTGRTVFHAGGNGLELRCPRCETTFEPGPPWMDLVKAWYEGSDGPLSYSCPSCGDAQPLVDWTGPWPWGFGYLGLEFNNWPPLTPEFSAELSAVIGGRVRFVRCHI